MALGTFLRMGSVQCTCESHFATSKHLLFPILSPKDLLNNRYSIGGSDFSKNAGSVPLLLVTVVCMPRLA